MSNHISNETNTELLFLHQILEEKWKWFFSEKAVILLGHTSINHLSTCIEQWMDEWVNFVDNELAKLERYSETWALWMEKRGFTFREYLLLFNLQVSVKASDWYPVFDFLMVDQEEHRKALTQYLSPTPRDFQKLLAEYPNCPPTQTFGNEFSVNLPLDNLRRHTYILGASGSGKSELMKSMVYHLQTLPQKVSIVVMEPHGQLVEELRNLHINKEQRERLIYIDPFLDDNYTPIINPLELANKAERQDEQLVDTYSQNLTKAISELIEGTSLSAQMEAVLHPCISTLLRKGNSSLYELQRFMLDDENDDLVELGKQSPNRSHQTFFKNTFKSKGKGAKTGYQTTKQSIYTKLQKLLGTRAFSRVTTGHSLVNLTKATDDGKVVLFNLSKGKMGEDSSQALGKLLIAMIKNIALRRAHQTEEERIPTFVFIDECQNYLSPSIEKILSEARKYRVYLVMANQNLEQIDDSRLKGAIFSNTNVKIVGQNSPKNLKAMAQEISIPVEELTNMKDFHFCAQVGSTPPFIFRGSGFLATQQAEFSMNIHDLSGQRQYLLDRYYRWIENLVTSEDTPKSQKNEPASAKTDHNKTGAKAEPKYTRKTQQETTKSEDGSINPKPKYTRKKSQ